ncbi:NERD domain-containing protein [Nocardia vermiculata]|uniref:NERD domain-containing protein n=1 Tax=Nocardia vermiculata TaxID=257274 RepID=A0A846Y2Z0_9NOCA|nr:nuclease-related domain-containing protein [Nocardia vermiculata]NKY52585.1 hypothetical protein [Nocardia vermiculata]
MLIINAETGKPRTERQVLEFLQDYGTNPGVAISGLNVPDQHRRRTTEADIVVFTPFTAAVIEVKGILEPSGGTLFCGSNGRWSLSGVTGDPVHVRAHDRNPLDQVSEPMFGLKNLARVVGRDDTLFVNGLVVVVPHPGASVSLDKPPLPTGRDVLLGAEPTPLWQWFNRKAFQVRDDPWTVELVIAVLAATGLDQARIPEQAAALRAALLREGFTSDTPLVAPAPTGEIGADASFEFSPPPSTGDEILSGSSAGGTIAGATTFSGPPTSRPTDDEHEDLAGIPPGFAIPRPADEESADHAGIPSDTAGPHRLGEKLSGIAGHEPAHPRTTGDETHLAEAAPADRIDAEPHESPSGTGSHGVSRVLPFRSPTLAGPQLEPDPRAGAVPGPRPAEPEPEQWAAPATARRRSRHQVQALAVLGALAAVLVCFVWYLGGSDSATHSDAGDRPADPSTAEAPPAAPMPVAPLFKAPTTPAGAEAPAPQQSSGLFPQQSQACYPFQTDC